LNKNEVKVVRDDKGASKTIIGLVDIKAMKFYDFSVKTLVHLCHKSINLFKEDLEPQELDSDIKNETLGLPLPSLYP
jgi:hypothetical protein